MLILTDYLAFHLENCELVTLTGGNGIAFCIESLDLPYIVQFQSIRECKYKWKQIQEAAIQKKTHFKLEGKCLTVPEVLKILENDNRVREGR